VLRVEDLGEYERGVLLADAALARLDSERRQYLAAQELEASKAAFLEEFIRLFPQQVDDLTSSDFWQSRLFSFERNYQYSGAGIELYRAKTWRLVTLFRPFL
jgi:hypothetical protein